MMKIKTMRWSISVFLIILFTGSEGLKAQSGEPILLGYKYELFSEILEEERSYWVSLPNDYNLSSQTDKTYSVLVLLDGAAHFHFASGIVHSMSSGNSDKRKIPPMIVVGVVSTQRERDFTPDKIQTRRENQTGGGDRFLTFLERELLPELEGRYRTSGHRILVGHSLAGLITTHSYLSDTSGFHAFIAVDPSFGMWDEKVLEEKTSTLNSTVFQRPFFSGYCKLGKEKFSKSRSTHSVL